MKKLLATLILSASASMLPAACPGGSCGWVNGGVCGTPCNTGCGYNQGCCNTGYCNAGSCSTGACYEANSCSSCNMPCQWTSGYSGYQPPTSCPQQAGGAMQNPAQPHPAQPPSQMNQKSEQKPQSNSNIPHI